MTHGTRQVHSHSKMRTICSSNLSRFSSFGRPLSNPREVVNFMVLPALPPPLPLIRQSRYGQRECTIRSYSNVLSLFFLIFWFSQLRHHNRMRIRWRGITYPSALYLFHEVVCLQLFQKPIASNLFDITFWRPLLFRFRFVINFDVFVKRHIL